MQLGSSHVFRFNHPTEAKRLKERGKPVVRGAGAVGGAGMGLLFQPGLLQRQQEEAAQLEMAKRALAADRVALDEQFRRQSDIVAAHEVFFFFESSFLQIYI